MATERLSRGVAQPGRALALGAKGREFESRRPDQSFRSIVEEAVMDDVALNDAERLGAAGVKFEHSAGAPV